MNEATDGAIILFTDAQTMLEVALGEVEDGKVNLTDLDKAQKDYAQALNTYNMAKEIYNQGIGLII